MPLATICGDVHYIYLRGIATLVIGARAADPPPGEAVCLALRRGNNTSA